MLHAAEVGDQHGEPEGDGAAHAVLQPRRPTLDVRAGALLGATTSRRRPLGRRPRSCSIQLRRSAAAARSTFIAICEATKLSSWALKAGSSDGDDVARGRQRRGGGALELGRAARPSVSRASWRAAGDCSRRVEQVRAPLEHAAAADFDGAGMAVEGRGPRPRRPLHDDVLSHFSSSTSRTAARAAGAQARRSIGRGEEHVVEGLRPPRRR